MSIGVWAEREKMPRSVLSVGHEPGPRNIGEWPDPVQHRDGDFGGQSARLSSSAQPITY